MLENPEVIKANISPPIKNCMEKNEGVGLVGFLTSDEVVGILAIEVTNPQDQEGILKTDMCPATKKIRNLVYQPSFSERRLRKIIALCMSRNCLSCLGVPDASLIPGTIYR